MAFYEETSSEGENALPHASERHKFKIAVVKDDLQEVPFYSTNLLHTMIHGFFCGFALAFGLRLFFYQT